MFYRNCNHTLIRIMTFQYGRNDNRKCTKCSAMDSKIAFLCSTKIMALYYPCMPGEVSVLLVMLGCFSTPSNVRLFQ